MTEEHNINYDQVGTTEEFVAVAPAGISTGIDDALGLQPISIRLQKDLLDNLKELAKLNGLGYQPLIRQVLTRWVDCELKDMLRAKAKEAEATARATALDMQAIQEQLRKAA